MGWLRVLKNRVSANFNVRRLDAELDAELREHIDLAVEERMRNGATHEDARREALREFGGVTQTREAYRVQRGIPGILLIETVARDLRLALRGFLRSPGFAAATIVTLALGIGTALALFAIVNGVLLKPLPFTRPEQIYEPQTSDAKGEELFGATYAEILEWQQAARDKAEIAFTGNALAIIETPVGAQMLTNVQASANLLSMLGAQPMLGRTFSEAERENGQSHVVILSYAVWVKGFSSDRGVLGRTVHIGGVPYTVIGVMPPRFSYPVWENRMEVWTPIELSAVSSQSPPTIYTHSLNPILRLRPGVSAAALGEQLTGLEKRLSTAVAPDEDRPSTIRLVWLHDNLVGGAKPALMALEVAVGLVWLIACSNVAGLLLARIAARRMEFAVRGALGAARKRIVAQFLTESLLLSATGGAAGLGVAALILRAFGRMLAKALPLAENIGLDWRAGGILVAMTLATGLLFGFFPAMIAAATPAAESLRSGARTASAGRGQGRLRGALLITQIALSMVLLSGAGLMMRTIYALRQVPLGFRTDHIVLTDLTIPNYLYKDRDVNTAAWRPLLDRVQHAPGVRSAALATVLPIGHPIELLTLVYATAWTKGNVNAAVRAASPDLMRVLGIRLRAGRFFTEQDSGSSLSVAVVNQTFVDRYLGGGNALGKQIRFGRIPRTATIAGVLEDIHQDALTAPSMPELYVPIAQLDPTSALYTPLIGRNLELAVRTEAAPGEMIAALRRAIRDQNPSLAIGNFTTMDEAVTDSIGNQRMAAGILGAFAALALTITVVGLYGLLSYMVAQRSREIGIRMALGADRGDVMRIVLRQALILIATGLAVGLTLAIMSERLMERFLFGVGRYDPWTLVLAPAVMALCGVVAAVLPARRAASIDPMRALRTE